MGIFTNTKKSMSTEQEFVQKEVSSLLKALNKFSEKVETLDKGRKEFEFGVLKESLTTFYNKLHNSGYQIDTQIERVFGELSSAVNSVSRGTYARDYARYLAMAQRACEEVLKHIDNPSVPINFSRIKHV